MPENYSVRDVFNSDREDPKVTDLDKHVSEVSVLVYPVVGKENEKEITDIVHAKKQSINQENNYYSTAI